jgi:hypothetical protein
LVNKLINFIALLLGISCFNTAYAWSGVGHRLIASIAWSQMTPDAQKMAVQLLISGHDSPNTPCENAILDKSKNAENTFVGAASWLDCVRSFKNEFPQFSMYHADRYPLCSGLGISKCKTSHCATDSLKQAIEDINSPASTIEKQRIALKIIIHLMGDLHQPLHVVATGPIEVKIQNSEGNQVIGLHAYWDSNVSQTVRSNKLLRELIANKSTEMAQGTLDDWMAETENQGREIAYGELLGTQAMCKTISDIPVTLTPNYEEKATNLGTLKIAEAGVRLAVVLNQAAVKNKTH